MTWERIDANGKAPWSGVGTKLQAYNGCIYVLLFGGLHMPSQCNDFFMYDIGNKMDVRNHCVFFRREYLDRNSCEE